MSLILRNEKGSQLTFNEMDGNFTYLEELSQTGSFTGSFIGDGSGLTGIPGVTPIETGSFATTGSNIFVGNQEISGSVTVSGSISQVGIGANNTIIGRGTGNPTGTGINTLVGVEAGKDLTTGFRNTFFGAGAGQATSIGNSNTYIGQSAGNSNTSGSSNIAVGRFAGVRLLDGTTPATQLGNSIFIGNFTESDGDSIFNQIVIGDSAKGGGQNTVTLGNDNIVSTRLKGSVSASIFSGSFIGDGSGLTGIPGVTPIETSSFATTGSNIFIGNQIISGSTTISGSISQDGIGEGNTFIGSGAGLSNTTGTYNAFIGSGSGASNIGGSSNIAVGPDALGWNQYGSNNVTIGDSAGRYFTGFNNNTTASNSVFIGSTTQANANNETNQIVIGSFVTGNGSNTVTIGNNNIVSTHLKGTVFAPTFTGSFVGDGSGLTGIAGGGSIDTSSFATTGSNVFVGTQTITQGSINVQGSGSYKEFITQMNSSAVQSIRGRGIGLYDITHQGDGTVAFTVSRITLNDLTGAITSNLSGANNGNYSDAQPETNGRGKSARLQLTVSGGTVTSVKVFTADGNPDFEEYNQPANRQGVGYKAGDTLTIAAGTGGIGGTGNLVITLRPQDIDTYIGHSPSLTFDYSVSSGNRNFKVPGFVESTGLIFGQDAVISGGGFSSVAGGQDVDISGNYSMGIGFGLSSAHQASTVFGAFNTTGDDIQTVVGLANNVVTGTGAFVIGNGSSPSDRSNLLVAVGNTVQITGSFQVTGSANITGEVTASSFLGDASYTTSGRWTVGNNGTSDYTFTGIGFLSTTNDPVLYLARGRVYEFVITSGGSHPFQIRLSNGGAAYNDGVTNNTATSGVVRFEIPFNAPNTLYYQCTNHSEMGNVINVYPSI